jgi:hypothetical protein
MKIVRELENFRSGKILSAISIDVTFHNVTAEINDMVYI